MGDELVGESIKFTGCTRLIKQQYKHKNPLVRTNWLAIFSPIFHTICNVVFQELVINRYLPRDGGVGGFRSLDGSGDRGRNEASTSAPSRRGRSRTNSNAVDSPAVKDGWLVSEGQSARKRGKTRSSAPAAPPTSSDAPIAISDTDDEASSFPRPNLQQSSLSAAADENDIDMKRSGKRARSSASGSASATACTNPQAGGRGRSRVRKTPSVLEWPPMSIVMTTYGPGIVLRVRKNRQVCVCGFVYRLP